MCGGGEHMDFDGSQTLERSARIARLGRPLLHHLDSHPQRILSIQGQADTQENLIIAIFPGQLIF